MATKTKWIKVKATDTKSIDDVVNAFIKEIEKHKVSTVQYQAVPTASGVEHYAFVTYHTKDEKENERHAGFIR